MGLEDEISEVEREISDTPRNKATEEHLGRLKAKLSRLREEREKRESSSGGSKVGYAPRKTGHATVVLVGFPSVGKSTLLNALTNADSEVGSYSFTTVDVVPGMMELNGLDVQLLDVPGLIGGAGSGRGNGREVLSVVRTADLVLLMADVFDADQVHRTREELRDVGIRLDQEPPDVRFDRRESGGIDIRSTVEQSFDGSIFENVLREYGFLNGYVTVREEVDVERFIDALSGNRAYLPSLTVFNKVDLATGERVAEIRERFGDPVLISARSGRGLEELRERIADALDFIRVYLKPPSGEPDYDEPMVLGGGSTVSDAAERIHGNVASGFRWARVWGPSAKHDGQQVGADHVLMDGDVLTIVD
ncbi:MAG: GTPase Obg [Methanonatronarchaeales archaeon]|nr:GTPase Obg [Methanonatronarchaeales archaeon]